MATPIRHTHGTYSPTYSGSTKRPFEELSPREQERQTLLDGLTSLFTRIVGHLSEDKTPNATIGEIIIETPDILPQLIDIKKDDLHGCINSYCGKNFISEEMEANIRTTLLKLYSTSLLNSSWGETVKKLETEITELVALSKTGQDLKQETKDFLKESPDTENLDSIRQYQFRANRLIGKIAEYLKLFFYIDSRNKEKIENVYTYATRYTAPLYPKCKAQFPELCSNMFINRSLQAQLNKLSRKTLDKHRELDGKAALLSERRQAALPLKREHFLNHDVLLWNCGSSLIKNAFTESRKRGELPPLTTDQEIIEHWGTFLAHDAIVDISDLMRHIIGRLPEAEFEKLELASKTAERESVILKVIEDYITTELEKEPITFLTLKNWIH